MNPGLDRCGEFDIDQQGAPHSGIVLDVWDGVPVLFPICPAQVALPLLSVHIPDADLADLV